MNNVNIYYWGSICRRYEFEIGKIDVKLNDKFVRYIYADVEFIPPLRDIVKVFRGLE